MVSLKETLKAIPAGTTSRYFGKAYWDGARWWAMIDGSPLDARWLDPIQPLQGGNIVVDITNDGKGLATALVIGGYTDQPRPGAGSVLTVGMTEIVFTGEDGGSYATDRFVGTYSPGDPVLLKWDAGKPTIIGKIPSIAVTPPAAPPATPAGPGTGLSKRNTTASDTYGVGGWGRWATSQHGGEDVYSGSQGGYTVTGAWFYGPPDPALAGKTVSRIRFNLPARLPGPGDPNSPAVIHIYAHNSQSRPGGDVARTAGPWDVTVPAGFQGGYLDVPDALRAAFAPILAGGGGLSIAGGPYIGFESRLDNPEAGKLLTDWTL